MICVLTWQMTLASLCHANEWGIGFNNQDKVFIDIKNTNNSFLFYGLNLGIKQETPIPSHNISWREWHFFPSVEVGKVLYPFFYTSVKFGLHSTSIKVNSRGMDQVGEYKIDLLEPTLGFTQYFPFYPKKVDLSEDKQNLDSLSLLDFQCGPWIDFSVLPQLEVSYGLQMSLNVKNTPT